MKTVEWGLLGVSLVMAAGIIFLPPLGLHGLENLFTTAWVFLGTLVAAAYIIEVFVE